MRSAKLSIERTLDIVTIQNITIMSAVSITSTLLVVAWLFHIMPASSFLSPQITSARPSCWNEALRQIKPKKHVVDGIECVEVIIDIPLVGPVKILEATVESQEALVNMSLKDSGSQLNAGDPYGTVLWPAASAVAAYMMKNNLVQGSSVLELGTGTGLVSIIASLGGASRVLATDYESVPLRLLEYACRHLNSIPITTRLLDLCDDSTPLPFADLVVAADTMYERKTGKAMARRTEEALRQGSRVLVGTSPGRAGRQAFVEELEILGVKGEFVSVDGWTCCGARHDLICGKGSTSVSTTPRPLSIDIMDLDPATCL